jgi:hypothetical protein
MNRKYGTIRSDASGGLHIEMDPSLEYSDEYGWRHPDEPDPKDPEFQEYMKCLRAIISDYVKDKS